MNKTKNDTITYSEIFTDPGRYFDTPQSLLNNTQFDKTMKKEILMAWIDLAKERSTATNEGMTKKEGPSLLEKITKALNDLDNIII